MDETAWPREKTDMGMNDHIPVPDPKPKYRNPEEAKEAEKWEAPLRKLSVRAAALESIADAAAGLATDAARDRAKLREENTKLRTDGIELAIRLGTDFRVLTARVDELKNKLKTTIKAVEKLAKGKSLGALGLPMEEDWK